MICRDNRIILASASMALFAWLAGCERNAPRDQVSKSQPSDRGAGDDVNIETVPVAGNIYMLVGKGGNIGVSVGEDGVLIIDDQFAPLADKIRAAIREIDKGDLEFVLNTHHHDDHTGGNVVFAQEGTVIAHDNVRRHLVEGNEPRGGWPVVTFDRTLTVHFNGEAIRAVHFAHSHTDGDSVIFFDKSNVVHTGDLFFNGRFPFVDIDGGGDPVNLAGNIQRLIETIKPDAKIIPGHGPLASIDDLRTYHAMLIETTEAVRSQMAAGKALADIKKTGMPAKYKEWGTGYVSEERWIDILHTALSKK